MLHRVARLAREKKAKELKEKREAAAKEAKEKRDTEMRTRQEAQQRSEAQARAIASAAQSAAAGGSSAGGSVSATAVAAAARSSVAPPPGTAPPISNGTSISAAARGASAAAAGAAAARPASGSAASAPPSARQPSAPAAESHGGRAIIDVMGLSPRIAKEEILRRHEYFGQYGKVRRERRKQLGGRKGGGSGTHRWGAPTAPNGGAAAEECVLACSLPTHPLSPLCLASLHCVCVCARALQILRIVVSPTATLTNGPPSLRCAITYASREEAEQAVLAVDNVVLDGRTLKASLFMGRGHDEADDDGLGKEESAHAASPPAQAPPAPAAAPPAVRPNDRGNREVGAAGRGETEVSVTVSSHERPPNVGGGRWEGGSAAPAPAVPSRPGGAAARPETIGHVPGVMGGSREVGPPGRGGAPGLSGVMDVTDAVVGGGAGGPVGGLAVGLDPVASSRHVGGSGMIGGVEIRREIRSGGVGGQPTGAESEPFSILGGFGGSSFEDLLHGLVGEEVPEIEDDAAALPNNSRFARFFSSDDGGGAVGGGVIGGGYHHQGAATAESSALSALSGIALDGLFESNGGKPNKDEWQQDFRALLPNVNISFSPFDQQGGGGGGGEGVEQVGGGRLGGLFGNFGPSQPSGVVGGVGMGGGAVGVSGLSGSAPGGGAFGGGGMGVGAVGNSFDSGNSLGVGTLGPSSLNGPSLPGLAPGPPSKSEVSLLHQLTAGASAGSLALPGAQLPSSHLSSQLQSLLQGNGNAAPGQHQRIASGRAPGGGGWQGSSRGADGRGADGRGADAAAGGAGGGSLPGWLQGDAMLGKAAEEAGAGEGSHKDGGGHSARGSGSKKEAGGGDRGGKTKKRGGTNNRSKGDSKPPHGGGGGGGK